jgi:HNH endonuclease
MPKGNTKRNQGSRTRILNFLLANIGRVVNKDEIRGAAANASEWARRLRELRDEYGYQILSHNDRRELKPGQYLLETDKRIPALPRAISKETRAFVLERNGYTCQMCGAGAGDPDPFHPGQRTRLTMGHILDKSKGGKDTPGNLRATCTNCNEGLQNTSPPKPDRIELMKQARRATIEDQLHLLGWLEKKFEKIRPDKD